jgi:ferric-dicitrate binding protein FerR (iron transport regulator)
MILLPVIIIGGILLVKNFTRHSASQYTTIISGKGVRKQICLPDGTKVWLNSESNLSFDNEMTQKITRDVTLVGEAFFEVAHDKKHPFIVHTEKMAIKVLGTEFNVMAYPNDKQATATLIRGSIELSVNKFPQQKIILKPSERFAMIDNKKNQDGESKETGTFENVTLKLENLSPIKVQGTEYIAETAWVDNKLVFKNESFSELVPKLERWFNVRIKIDDPEKLKYHFTGIFTNENIDQALNAMKVIKPFNFKINENDVNIY